MKGRLVRYHGSPVWLNGTPNLVKGDLGIILAPHLVKDYTEQDKIYKIYWLPQKVMLPKRLRDVKYV